VWGRENLEYFSSSLRLKDNQSNDGRDDRNIKKLLSLPLNLSQIDSQLSEKSTKKIIFL
jgi:hypothetical protein